MKLQDLKTIAQSAEFLSGNQAVAFSIILDKDDCYRWIQGTLYKFHYRQLGKQDKGVLIRYLMKISGYSRQQITRLIAQYRKTGKCKRRQRTAAGFTHKFTPRDIRLLVAMDKVNGHVVDRDGALGYERHDTPCGPAVKKLCERAYGVFGQLEYAALASISVSHLYNLRKPTPTPGNDIIFEKTRSRPSSIGERRKPQPDGKPGYIRIDTVHQGCLNKRKGAYHIKAIGKVTQFEVVCAVEKIRERYLIPALEQLLESFPFQVLGFHSDNGSEYINKNVAELLEKLRIEFTKSRSRDSNDNALVESKNGAVVRKLFGHTHIPQRWAPLINDFNQQYLNPYLNFHRHCFFPETLTDNKGKQRKVYR